MTINNAFSILRIISSNRILALLFVLILLLFSCHGEEKKEETEIIKLPIVGTWKLLKSTTIENGDTTFTDYTSGQKMLKIINNTHFAFLRHDLAGGKDSTALFVAGGGEYTLVGSTYTEHLEFCNFREYENNVFEFQLYFKGDTLIQTGIEKVESIDVERIITEKYLIVK
jgi:hypothetical protein